PGFASGEYLSARFVVERETEAGANTHADSVAADSARAIVKRLLARLSDDPRVSGATVTVSAPWETGASQIEVEGANMPPQGVGYATVDTSFFGLYDVRVLAGRTFSPGDAALRPGDRPVIVNRRFVAELIGSGDAVGRRVRYRDNDDSPWMTIAGVV